MASGLSELRAYRIQRRGNAGNVDKDLLMAALDDAASELFQLRARIRDAIGDTLKDAEEAFITGSGPYAQGTLKSDAALTERSERLRKTLYDLDHQMGEAARDCEGLALAIKRSK